MLEWSEVGPFKDAPIIVYFFNSYCLRLSGSVHTMRNRRSGLRLQECFQARLTLLTPPFFEEVRLSQAALARTAVCCATGIPTCHKGWPGSFSKNDPVYASPSYGRPCPTRMPT